MKIKKVVGQEILDSRGNPTVDVTVFLENGMSGRAAVPSGASTGSHEAMELRDGGKRYGGKGVKKAVANVNGEIAKMLAERDVLEQEKIDADLIKLDGTANKSRLGANAILGVSLACARAAAVFANLPLYRYLRQVFDWPVGMNFKMPKPMMNVLNGGVHADSGLEVQEFMIVPQQSSMSERVRAGAEVFQALKSLLKKSNFSIGVGDEGGFAPRLKNNEEALKKLMLAIKQAGYIPGKEVALAADVASSEFFVKEKYAFESKKNSGAGMMKIYQKWLKKYPLISLEDPLAEDDWDNWQKMTFDFGKRVMLVGDDLFVTNVDRLQKGIKSNVANAILIKLNQIGTLTETIAAIRLARENNFQVVISHRSGETADTFIADLAVAINAEFIKTGSLSRSERVEKYNRLMEIEKELG